MKQFLDKYHNWKNNKPEDNDTYQKGDWKFIIFDFLSLFTVGILSIIAFIIIITM